MFMKSFSHVQWLLDYSCCSRKLQEVECWKGKSKEEEAIILHWLNFLCHLHPKLLLPFAVKFLITKCLEGASAVGNMGLHKPGRTELVGWILLTSRSPNCRWTVVSTKILCNHLSRDSKNLKNNRWRNKGVSKWNTREQKYWSKSYD